MVEVAILSGSASDAAIAERVAAVLEEQGITYDSRVISAHREPDILDEYIKKSDCKVFIAIAGLSAALPGVIASKTQRPVIGVPVSGTLMGLMHCSPWSRCQKASRLPVSGSTMGRMRPARGEDIKNQGRIIYRDFFPSCGIPFFPVR